MSDDTRHPDPVRLDAVRAGAPLEPDDVAHVAACGECKAAISDLADVATGLKLLHEPARLVAPKRDDRMLQMARERVGQARDDSTTRSPFHTAVIWIGVAALAVVCTLLWARRDRSHVMSQLTQVAPGPPIAPAASAAIADLDGDGRVTVLDAFIVARAVEAGRRDPAFDVNRDGRVDEDDVSAVLALAVSVGTT